MMPVAITSAAVSDGKPPSCSEMPIATGVVTDFGASDASASRVPPRIQPMPTADPAAAAEPAMTLASSASADRRTRSNWCVFEQRIRRLRYRLFNRLSYPARGRRTPPDAAVDPERRHDADLPGDD